MRADKLRERLECMRRHKDKNFHPNASSTLYLTSGGWGGGGSSISRAAFVSRSVHQCENVSDGDALSQAIFIDDDAVVFLGKDKDFQQLQRIPMFQIADGLVLAQRAGGDL